MVGYKGPINDQAKRFSRIELKFRREWREKVVDTGMEIPRQEKVVRETPGACATGYAAMGAASGPRRCAFSIDSEGNVESIQPEEFLEVYRQVEEDAQKRMLKLVKGNGNKVAANVNHEINAEEARRHLNQLVHHDEMTEHIELVDMTGTVQDLDRWNKNTEVPKTASEFVTAVHEKISTRLNKVRLSGAKIVASLAKNPDIENINKAGKVYGHLMVAKGIINGIIHNDTTSLAVIGGRFGYDIVTETAVKVGEKFFNAATKVGKAARVLSKVAGPIGAAIDVGLGAWSLSKSVDRLKKADNKYDRDDAIADIVSQSIDMAVSITVAALSVAFPPAAPIIAAVGLIISIVNNIVNSLFHASNEVARINAQIPLLEHEKVHVFTSRFFDIFGTRGKDYIDYLVEEKKANDLAVANYLDFLKNNTQFSGVVFPSRTLAYEGKCYLKIIYDCPVGTWAGRPLCAKQDVIGRGCDWNKPCGPGGRYCMDEQGDFYFFDCICDGKETTEFGHPHKNSLVDFRARRNVYWERAVPGDKPGAEFRCKPGSTRFIHYKISQTDSINHYHCENAIGLYRPEKDRTSDQTYLVDLQDGNDEFYVDRNGDLTSYTFWMGEEGHKNFYGGNRKNDFVLSGNCSSGLLNGILNGGPKESDSLIIAPTCGKGQTIEVKADGKFYYVKLQNMLNLRLEEIENIIGRPNDAEKVEVSCNTRSAFLNGGANSKNPDSILIDPPLGCRTDFQTLLGNYTNVVSQQVRGDVTIYVGEDMTGSIIHIKKRAIDRYVKSPNLSKTTVIFTQTKSQEVNLDDIAVTENEVSLKLKDHTRREPLTIKYSKDISAQPDQQHQIFFNESSVETPNSFSVLMVPGNEKAAKDSALTFFHNLQPHNGRSKIVKRTGSDNIPNLFNISGRDWDIRGGAKDDTFLLNVPYSHAKLDGGAGSNTLLIESSQDSMIDLNGLNGIQTVVKGKSAGAIEISASCKTKAIVVNGDKSPDIVRINSCSEKRELQIDAAGSARVLVEGRIDEDNEIVQILAHQAGQHHVTFELNAIGSTVPRLSVQIQLESDNKELFVNELVRLSNPVNSFHVNLKGAGLGSVVFKLTDNVRDNGAFISSPQINLIPPKQSVRTRDPNPVQLVFKRDTLEPVAIYHVNEGKSAEQIVKGFGKVENLFQLHETTTLRTVHGGNFRDTFIGTSKALSFVHLQTFAESDNTLIVKDDLSNSIESRTTFKIDLSENWMGLLLKDSTRRASVQGHYHHLIGRVNQPDTIVGSCTTKTIAGRGGSARDKLDSIELKANSNCSLPTVDMYLGPYTKVDNQAEIGLFKYFVDLTQYAEYLSFAIHSTDKTANNIIFTLPSLEKRDVVAVHSIEFDKEQKSLTFTVKDTTTAPGVYEFLMYQKDETSEFSDPQFSFTTSGDNWATTDVRVNKHGTVIATTVLSGDCSNDRSNMKVKGMPVGVNNFLVNITGSGDFGNCGNVEGHIESTENHIWLYRLPRRKSFRIVGSDKSYFRDGNLSMNTLHVDENFYDNKPLTAYFGYEGNGFLDMEGAREVDLKWIDNYAGRNNPNSYDMVIPSCSMNQVSGVDLVKILLDPRSDCTYQLLVELQPMTRVEFDWMEDENDERRKYLVNFWNSTFYYRFSKPMSFEIVQKYAGMLDGTVHNFYLPLNLDELETLAFDVEESKLHYTVESEEYSITMVSEPDDEDQFYPQPNMVTRDGFRIQIGRDGSVLVTKFLNNEPSQPLELLSMFQEIANTLVITMVIKTDDTFLHIGNDGSTSDRNVLQNLASSVSYMGGGGADDIYEVVSLNKDVYISTGLENVSLAPAVNAEGPYIAKQTLDLTDIVAPIRLKLGIKYKPKVFQEENNLVIIMHDYQLEHPGKVVVYNGATESVRKNLQILLSNAMMEFVRLDDHMWDLSPVDVQLERETVYSIAAEDLEYNHRINVLDHKYGREYRFHFRLSKKDDDLQLSDIEEFRGHKYDQQHIEMTTVIITDFYKEIVPSRINSFNGTYDAPTEIRNVTLFMPGLIIRLDGTDVQHFHINEDDKGYVERIMHAESTPTTSIPSLEEFCSPTTISIDMVPTWSSVIHNLENDILEGLPYVNRTY